MSSTAAVDNDVLYKAAWFGLLSELLAVVPTTPAETLILGHAKYVVTKRLERQKKKGTPNAEQVLKNLSAMLAELSAAEPSIDELALAAELENAALLAGLALDGGESLLCSMLVHRNLHSLVTGDKRAIAALEAMARNNTRLTAITGKVLCIEQLFVRLLANSDPVSVKKAVCRNAHVDRALATCFSCSSPEVGPEQWRTGLDSYIEATRNDAPTVLSRTVA
jgi:hypothetical protein